MTKKIWIVVSGLFMSIMWLNVANAQDVITSSDSASTDMAAIHSENDDQHDPLESINRVTFAFNDTLDGWVFKPVARVYNKIMPKPLNDGVHNFFNNLTEVPSIANDLLQLNFYQAANDAWRFGINTTVGIGGFIDVASRMGLHYHSNDMGLTFARYGYTNSTYIVVPFIGSFTVRDGVGFVGDYYAFSAYHHINDDNLRYSLLALAYIDRRAHLLKFEPVVDEAAVDKYAFVRSAYLQRRSHQIKEVRHMSRSDQMDQPVASTEDYSDLGEPVATTEDLDVPVAIADGN